MDLFISWSGKTSQEIAEELNNWIPKVLQFVKPYFTPSDIEKGAKWESEITKKLEECSIGIICLTKENTEKPWILFEAGALSNKLNKSRVCPLLFGLNSTDLTGPLATFQTTSFNKSEFKKLMATINNQSGSSRIVDTIFEDVFETYFPRLEKNIKSILTSDKTDYSKNKTLKRTDREILEEILELARRQYNPPFSKNDSRMNIDLDFVFIDIFDFRKSKLIQFEFTDNTSFRELLDEIYFNIRSAVESFTYEYDWILKDKTTGKEFKSIVMSKNIPKGNEFEDYRTLKEVGIEPGMILKAYKI